MASVLVLGGLFLIVPPELHQTQRLLQGLSPTQKEKHRGPQATSLQHRSRKNHGRGGDERETETGV